MSTDSHTDGSSDSPARAFVREFLRPYLGEIPPKFLLFELRGKFYASVARKENPGVEGLVALAVRPLSERQYHQIKKVYEDSVVCADNALDFVNSNESHVDFDGVRLGALKQEQRVYLSKSKF